MLQMMLGPLQQHQREQQQKEASQLCQAPSGLDGSSITDSLVDESTAGLPPSPSHSVSKSRTLVGTVIAGAGEAIYGDQPEGMDTMQEDDDEQIFARNDVMSGRQQEQQQQQQQQQQSHKKKSKQASAAATALLSSIHAVRAVKKFSKPTDATAAAGAGASISLGVKKAHHAKEQKLLAKEKQQQRGQEQQESQNQAQERQQGEETTTPACLSSSSSSGVVRQMTLPVEFTGLLDGQMPETPLVPALSATNLSAHVAATADNDAAAAVSAGSGPSYFSFAAPPKVFERKGIKLKNLAEALEGSPLLSFFPIFFFLPFPYLL